MKHIIMLNLLLSQLFLILIIIIYYYYMWYYYEQSAILDWPLMYTDHNKFDPHYKLKSYTPILSIFFVLLYMHSVV